MTYFVYIIQNDKKEKYYIGSTSDLIKRLYYHNAGYNRSTRNHGPWTIVYRESFEEKSEAIKREIFLKRQKNKSFYNRLINGM